MVHYRDRYKEESKCRSCGHWTPKATRSPINFGLVTVQEPNQGNEHYYNIGGKRVGVLIIHKIENLARRDKDGTFLQMIKELVYPVRCEECGKICSGGPLSKTDERKKKRKVQITIGKVGNEIKPVDKKVKWVKPSLPESRQDAKDHPSPRGRPKGRGRQKSK